MVSGSCTLWPGEADSAELRRAKARFGTCVTVRLKPPVLCADTGAVVVTGAAVVVSTALLISVFDLGSVIDGDGAVRGGVVTTGVIVGDEAEVVVVVVAAGRCVLVRGCVVVASCVLRGVGLTVGGLVIVVVVATGGVVVLAVVFCVAVCWPLRLFAPLRPVRPRGLFTGGVISVAGLVPAISVVGLPVICRGRGLTVGLLVAVVVEAVVVLGALGVGGLMSLAVLTSCERAGVGEGVAVATTALGLGSVVRAVVSRRALINSLS